MGRAALVAADRLASGEGDVQFMQAKIATARYYADALLPQVAALAHTTMHGGESALALAAEEF
jgi:acyl-CoA dehydrogenase